LEEENAMSESIKGRIHQVESFGSVDGPGVRYIVFLKGCHMRCRYCHNPETWKEEGGTLEPLSFRQIIVLTWNILFFLYRPATDRSIMVPVFFSCGSHIRR